MKHSLLDDPLFRVRLPNESVQGHSLPQILHRLAQDNVLSFEALQAHQQQAWHSFLVQLAAMAVAREAGGTMPSDARGWREVLGGLAGGIVPPASRATAIAASCTRKLCHACC